ncbi:WD40 repeat domain-containing protein [Allorhodopirellula heiligendammensis]|uniref:WD domain, G-beta repeat n=1 Tax=Allorhodopirellula heiligendammensis TaxID=2714739 RepID=A0A5C6BFX0_9BACT|nr:hypothetical protein [Allorhodopirellula heiligendammensis]TWU10401.1 WD domain, G-beta repeat [Allorhodopirellula heiligendammensis]
MSAATRIFHLPPVHVIACGLLLSTVVSLSPRLLQAQNSFDDDIKQAIEHAEALLLNREYEQLNALIADARAKKTRVARGGSLLTAYYEILGSPYSGAGRTRAAVNDRRQLLVAWSEKSPSVASQIALADSLWTLAKKYRGGGLAGTITTEGELGMTAALHEAELVLERAEQIADLENIEDPCIALYQMRVGHYLGHDRETMQEYLKKAFEIDPWFVTTTSAMSFYLLPRWYGEEGDLLQFAKDWSDATHAEIGDAVYAIVAMSAFDAKEETEFSETGFDWQRVKSGLLRWLDEVPDSPYRLGQIAYYAHIAHDRPVARDMIERLEGRWDTSIWRQEIDFQRTVRWAFDSEDPGESLHVVELGPYDVHRVSVINDGDSFVVSKTSAWPRSLSTYNIATGQKDAEHPLWPHTLDVVSNHTVNGQTAMSVSAGGQRMVILSDLRTEDFVSENAFSVVGQIDGYAFCIVTALSGDAIALGDTQGNVKFWRISDTPLPYQWKEALQASSNALALSPDGSRLLTGAYQTFKVWDTETRELLHTFESLSPRVYSAAWSPDGQTFAGAGAGGEIILWNADDFSERGRINTDAEFITSIAFSPDSQYLVAGTFSGQEPVPPGKVIVCKTDDQSVLKVLAGHRLNVQGVTFTPDGTRILSASADGSVRIWKMPAE